MSEGRIDGNLNLSRCIGDFEYKKDKKLGRHEQKIVCTPDFMSRQLAGNEEFLIVGCDGVWETMSNEEIVKFVGNKLYYGSTGSGKVPGNFNIVNLLKIGAGDERSNSNSNTNNMTPKQVKILREQFESPWKRHANPNKKNQKKKTPTIYSEEAFMSANAVFKSDGKSGSNTKDGKTGPVASWSKGKHSTGQGNGSGGLLKTLCAPDTSTGLGCDNMTLIVVDIRRLAEACVGEWGSGKQGGKAQQQNNLNARKRFKTVLDEKSYDEEAQVKKLPFFVSRGNLYTPSNKSTTKGGPGYGQKQQ